MNKIELLAHLDDYLNINQFKDYGTNGLQIDCEKNEIKKIGFSVDATSYIFDKAIKEKVDMIIVHHGFLLADSQTTITGLLYKQIKMLIQNNMALCGYHIPLDAHKKIGNNMGIINKIIKYFESKNHIIENIHQEGYEESVIYGIRLKDKIQINELSEFLHKKLGFENNLYNFGNHKYIRSIAVCSGSGLFELANINKLGYELYISGEGKHSNIIKAKQYNQSIFLGGHRETEVIGIKLLAQHIEKTFKLKTVFLDEKY